MTFLRLVGPASAFAASCCFFYSVLEVRREGVEAGGGPWTRFSTWWRLEMVRGEERERFVAFGEGGVEMCGDVWRIRPRCSVVLSTRMGGMTYDDAAGTQGSGVVTLLMLAAQGGREP